MFDATDELATLRQRKAALRRKRYNASKLAAWLRRRKRRQVHATTIRHYLLQLPEMHDNADLR